MCGKVRVLRWAWTPGCLFASSWLLLLLVGRFVDSSYIRHGAPFSAQVGVLSPCLLCLLDHLLTKRSHAKEGDIPGTVNLAAAEGDDTAYGQALFPVPAEDPNDP